MTAAPKLLKAVMAALPLPDAAGVPEWVHLLPSGDGAITTFDGRGPYRVENAATVIAASLADPRGMPIDENHATDLSAPKGGRALAFGWIKELQARADGIWGRVDWTAAGAKLLADRAYRGISPVFLHNEDGVVRRILRAALTNTPNLQGLTALNAETEMNLHARLAEKLGKPAETPEDDLLAAVPAPAATTALQSTLSEIGAALGVESGDGKVVLAAAKLLKASASGDTALMAENAGLKARLDAVEAKQRRAVSEAFVDKAIRELRKGYGPGNRDEMIALHLESPGVVERLTNELPTLGATHTGKTPPAAGGGTATLSAEQVDVCEMLGISQADFLKTLQAEEAR